MSIARTLAIRYHVSEWSTPARLTGVKRVVQESECELDSLVEAQGVFLDLILKQQITDLERGRPPSNAVEIKGLSLRDRKRLRAALQSVENLDELGRDLLFNA